MKDADGEALLAGADCVFIDARLIDGITDEPVDRGFVRVRGGRIAEAGSMSAYRKAGGDEHVVQVFVRDTALRAGAADGAQVHAQLLRARAHGRRGLHVAPGQPARLARCPPGSRDGWR